MASHDNRPPATTAAIAMASALVAGVTGYFLGQASALGLFGGKSKGRTGKTKRGAGKAEEESAEESELEESEEEEEEEEEEEAQANLSSFADLAAQEECKLVLVVRTDLGMGKGKIAAQASHATLACYTALLASDANHPLLRRWERTGQAKIAVQAPAGVAGEEGLEMLRRRARELGLCARVVRDAGRTQIAAGSATVLGVGPGPKSVVDAVTGGLRLL